MRPLIRVRSHTSHRNDPLSKAQAGKPPPSDPPAATVSPAGGRTISSHITNQGEWGVTGE
ncbi:hypothetical protein GCM10009733_063130 [Nonomuraea maheshkhaliensis]|uniref:Uncharacterized protein n=1 Tax=Nonomuraea maheshkhaliensis TaxID=419590 RepID=A0ABP4RLD7_9ACTN